MWNSLRIRLTIIFIGLAIGPLVLVGVILAQSSFTTEQAQALDLQFQVAQRISTEIDTFLGEVENHLNLLGGEIRSLENPDRAQQLSLLLSALSSGPYRNVYEGLTLLDGQGQERVRISRDEIISADQLADRSNTDEFSQVKTTGETYFGPVQFDTARAATFMTIAIPIFELRSIQLDGVLVADIRLKAIGDLIAGLQVSEGQTIYVVDSQGNVVAHPSSSAELLNRRIDLPEQSRVQSGLNDSNVVLAVDRIGVGDQILGIVTERAASEALAPAINTVYTIALTIVAALIIAGGLGFLVVRQIVRPVENLATTAQSISAGDLSQQVKVTSRDEIGTLARAFNAMTLQLQRYFETLEERIQERTQALETSAEISRRINTILDLDKLLQYVVNRLQTEFDFYHTHIYLVDEKTGELVMAEGSGDVGQQLKAQGHRLHVGQGIVGNVAKTGQAFLAENVDEVPNFFRNPLLPQTQSELTVPIRKGDKMLGVLDAQSEEIGGFSQEDLTLLQSIADQVAIAVDNARLFQQAQVAAAEAEALNRRLTRQVWEQVDDKIQTSGYVFSKSGVSPTPTEWLPAMTRALQKRELCTDNENGHTADQATTSVAVPLNLRGEVIGVIGIERPSDRGWTEDELITVQAITEQVALALDAARLAYETERAAWRDRMVSESTAQVWSSAEIEEVMRAAVAQLGDKLRASEVVIRLGTEEALEQE